MSNKINMKTVDGLEEALASKSNPIGSIITSTIPLNDAGLHLADGALISGSGSYADFVDYMAGLVSTYPELFDTEANWQQAVSDYGVCGKYVYDSVNNTIRLPKIEGFIEGILDPTKLGDLTEAGLPNITGSVNKIRADSGAVTKTGALNMTVASGGQTASGVAINAGTLSFNASLSNSIYGNSNTVQPQAIKVFYYVVIATSTKTAIEVDIDEIATDLNGKVDVDASNFNASGKSLLSGLGMPDTANAQFVSNSFATNTAFTAPANGWYCCRGTSSAAGHMTIFMTSLDANNNAIAPYNGGTYYVTAAGTGKNEILPVLKGKKIQVQYSNCNLSADAYCGLWFIPAKGEN